MSYKKLKKILVQIILGLILKKLLLVSFINLLLQLFLGYTKPEKLLENLW